ncbi:hypothetical protein CANCADRAFT_44711 [Tortispora caseinolytica NRRL Y-17796]|uniref:SET domain-containing protein n=1 Tax=Tortispora caseinolytica NRRL Y-17796 TaxID=767744 RepID=A0A1E4TH88_9ASCO|nr:hypothetical protein CANCADRAFT_44711 [Tortispora caseinolytica NRRL Y-17796]
METLTALIAQKGYISTKFSSADINGRGRALVATGNIQSNELLLRLPPSALINVTSLGKRGLPGQQTITHFVYEYLHDPENCVIPPSLDEQICRSYMNTLPPFDSFEDLPLTWSAERIRQLPTAAQNHVDAMRHELETDWNRYSGNGNESKEVPSQFLYAWLCVNTRVVFTKLPKVEHDDSMSMVPVLDFLNHTDDPSLGCKVIYHPLRGLELFSKTGTTVQDEELMLSYGPHDQEFLLCEYGFMLDSNQWQSVDVTAPTLELISKHAIVSAKSSASRNMLFSKQ